MHKYINAIGYGGLASEKQLNRLLQYAEKVYTHHELMALDQETDYCEYRMKSSKDMGICVCGTMDEEEHFERYFYYPYFEGSGITSVADVTLERRMDRHSFVGIYEDAKVGVSLIFHVQNAIECMLADVRRNHVLDHVSITLSGLCNDGMILLPVFKNPDQEKRSREESKNRMTLLTAARNGDPSAIESLTLDDLDTYTKVSRRLVKEDVFTIVDTYFMPCGIECDRYSILGEILNIRMDENEETGEEIYILSLNVNEMKFDACIPKANLIGEPAIGRRFKGNIWLQGMIRM